MGVALTGCIRGSDTLSRIDARQFVLLIAESTDTDHGALFRRIHRAADRIRSEGGDMDFSIHLSSAAVDRESADDGDRILDCTLACLESRQPTT